MDIRRLRVKNTKKGGVLEFLVYPEGGKYVGVCLTLDIIEVGSDPAKMMDSIREAAMGHVMLVIKKKLSDEFLNRPAPDEYWKKYFEAMEKRQNYNDGSAAKPAFFSQMPMPLSRVLVHA